MTEALINTLLGMGTVFIALIVISFIISLLKPISDLIQGTGNATKNIPISTTTVVETVNDSEEVDINKETELVAVITAAIMASYNENNFTPDGLVVRNIRRIKK